MKLGTLSQGGSSPIDYDAAHDRGRELAEDNRARAVAVPLEKPQSWTDRAVYSAAYLSAANAPTNGSSEGVETMVGRVWAEARNVEHSGGGGALSVTLIASQNSVRAGVECPDGTTLTAGSIRYWLQDPVTKRWGLGTEESTFALGAQRAWSSDSFLTVGGQ